MVFYQGIALLVPILALIAPQQTAAHASDPLTGTWKLNLAKSTYDPPELAAKTILATYDVKGNTITASLEGLDYMGRETRSEYSAAFDGKEYPTRGTIDGKPVPNQQAISWRKIDDRTYEVRNILNGRVLTTQRIVMAADGQSRTTTINGRDAQGRMVNNVLFFERQ